MMVSMSTQMVHPTKEFLIETVMTLLQSKEADQITSEEVLAFAGISRGSLYHHFADFPELIEVAKIRRFGTFVDRTIETLQTIATTSGTREEMITKFREIATLKETDEMRALRMHRITVISRAIHNPRMADALGLEQERLTTSIANLYREIVAKGWGNSELEPRTVAVMIQSCTVGKIIDDITPNHMNNENWSEAVNLVLETVIFPVA